MDRLISIIGSSSAGVVGLAEEYELLTVTLKNYTDFTINRLEKLRTANCELPDTYFQCENGSYKVSFNLAVHIVHRSMVGRAMALPLSVFKRYFQCCKFRYAIVQHRTSTINGLKQ